MKWKESLLMAAIVGTPLMAGCSESPTDTPADDDPAIELERVVNDDFGISTLVPRGWSEHLSGRFRRGASLQTELITEFYPSMDAAWLIASLILPAL
ncbi:MAG: hypothetical protein OER90_05080, partial [Gemmatimonadota bacterium]|nr:hypothetical protein [Gemmatimonadota bacterium]